MNGTYPKQRIKMSAAYLPKLFINAVGNAPSSKIYRVIEELGFGRVSRVEFRGNNAVVSMDWNVPYTTATRMILQEGVRPLSLYYSDTRFWKVVAYKSREQPQVVEPVAEKKPALSWVAMQIQQSKERIEKERLEKIKADPYYDFRTAIQKIHKDAVDDRRANVANVRAEIERMGKEYRAELALERERDEIIKRIQELEREREEREREEREREEREKKNMQKLVIIDEESDTYSEEAIAEDALDYGNVAEFYPMVRSIFRARIGLVA